MPYWLEDDAFHEWPVWEALAEGSADVVDRLQSAYARMKSLASHIKKDGYLTAEGALRMCRGRRQVLAKLCTPALEEKPLVHQVGDECPCLGDQPWIAGFAYRIHEFLKRNPSKREYDRNREQKRDLNDARLKAQVLARDGGCCRYCTSGPLSSKANRARDRRRVLQFDHVDPDQPAGPGADNLVVSCARCNEYKGKRTPDEAEMKLLPVPAPEHAAAMRQRPQQLFDAPPDTTTITAPINDESPPDQNSTVDRTVDPITDHQDDPIADRGAQARPETIDHRTDRPTEQPREGSGSGRGGPPDLIQAEPPHPDQPERSPAYPDIYSGRSRSAPAPAEIADPQAPFCWPAGSVPAMPNDDLGGTP